jgi:DNA polymerase/3'-5' exonuclease PolX
MKDKLKNILTQKISDADKNIIKISKLYNELIKNPGIGPEKANELIKLGLSNINQLINKKWESHLNSNTILLIKNKPLRNIPHNIIKQLEPTLINFKYADAVLVGGYIRKKPFSKDIDVMLITKTDEYDEKEIIIKYIEYLKKVFDKVYVYSQGSNKASLIIQYKTSIKNTSDTLSILNKKSDATKQIFLKVDIFITNPKYQHAMLLYAIGSKKFNIKMRSIARSKGFILNQYGLFKLPIQKNNKPINVKSEYDFFKILDIPYTLPIDR